MRQSLRRLGASRFAAVAELGPGPTTVTVVARTPENVRMRGVFRLRLSAG